MTSKIESQFVEKSNQLWQNHQDLVLNLINTLFPEQQSNTESEIVEKFSQLHPNHQDLVLKLINTLLAVQNPPPRKKPKLDWIGGLREYRDQYTALQLQKEASDLMVRGASEPTWKHYNAMENALIKDGWTITDHWLRLQRSKDLYVDLSGKQFLTAQKENRKIAVMVKDFNGPSDIADLQNALGQYTLYRNIIEETDPDRTLYLAVHEETFATIFEEALGQLIIRKNDLKLIVFNKTEEAIVKWNA